MSFTLKIVTPKGIYLEKNIELLNLYTPVGQIGILENHLPLVSAIEICKMHYIENKATHYYAISGGFVYVSKECTTIITDAIESVDEIDLDRAQSAKQRAKQRLESNNPDIDILRAQIALKRALNRISVKTGEK